jgi:hypothetical protein
VTHKQSEGQSPSKNWRRRSSLSTTDPPILDLHRSETALPMHPAPTRRCMDPAFCVPDGKCMLPSDRPYPEAAGRALAAIERVETDDGQGVAELPVGASQGLKAVSRIRARGCRRRQNRSPRPLQAFETRPGRSVVSVSLTCPRNRLVPSQSATKVGGELAHGPRTATEMAT